MVDIIIIGAGVIGAAIARELSKYKFDVVILEKDNDVSNGTTKANSGIIHAGYDARIGTNMARFNFLGNPMFDKLCNELDVPFKRIGSLVLGYDSTDIKELKRLYDNGRNLGIDNLEILNKEEVMLKEPNVSNKVIKALYASSAGIIGPWELGIALIENAIENGVNLKLNSEVKDIVRLQKGYKVITDNEEFTSKYIINCGGVYSDEINNMINERKIKITPRKGQYYLFDKDCDKLFNHIIFKCPTQLGKGVLIAPTVHGNLLVGPDSQSITDKENTETSMDRLMFIKESVSKISDKIPFNKVITTFSGLRANSETNDFIIEESKENRGFINVAGIKSPGLSASPAIAEYVISLLKEITGGLEKNNKFNPYRRRIIRFNELKDNEKIDIIRKDSKYGKVICRCENITEGEIVDIINRKAGATTVDGVKRRARPGSGRCQGGFCLPYVMEILARELRKDIKEIVKNNKNSFIITSETKLNDSYDIK